jgi:hypothetical protein
MNINLTSCFWLCGLSPLTAEVPSIKITVKCLKLQPIPTTLNVAASSYYLSPLAQDESIVGVGMQNFIGQTFSS